ncbi:MAG: hypothetical protein J0L55_13145 [Caulobacterales bacterium]|nr:hypothetical protein [Caulobacterales bacterium]
MSVTNLAEYIDNQLSANNINVAESESNVFVSGASHLVGDYIIGLLNQLEWEFSCSDAAGMEITENLYHGLDENFSPYQISILKPFADANTLLILTKQGIVNLLNQNTIYKSIKIARLGFTFATFGCSYSSWNEISTINKKNQSKSPRLLVRDLSEPRLVPKNLDYWVITDKSNLNFDDVGFKEWAFVATKNLIVSISTEVDAENKRITFKGAQRLITDINNFESSICEVIGKDEFFNLQDCVNWVYENERESDLRHQLIASEFSLCAQTSSGIAALIKENTLSVLDAARIAYQIHVSEITKDTIKTLTDLRKSVTDEMAKTNDIMRQFTGGLAGAITVCLGLILAKSTNNTPAIITIVVSIVAFTYVLILFLSGLQYVLLQRKLRKNWQPRLYRFLPEVEFNEIVIKPSQKVEDSFLFLSVFGLIAMAFLTCTVLHISTTSAAVSIPASKSEVEVTNPDTISQKAKVTPSKK